MELLQEAPSRKSLFITAHKIASTLAAYHPLFEDRMKTVSSLIDDLDEVARKKNLAVPPVQATSLFDTLQTAKREFNVAHDQVNQRMQTFRSRAGAAADKNAVAEFVLKTDGMVCKLAAYETSAFKLLTHMRSRTLTALYQASNHPRTVQETNNLREHIEQTESCKGNHPDIIKERIRVLNRGLHA